MVSFADEDELPPGLAQFVDDLTDKGKAKRASGLRGVVHALRCGTVTELKASLEPLFETLLHNIKGLLRKASGEEFAQACSVVSILGIVTDNGGARSSAVDELVSILLPLASAESTNPERAQQALFALGALTFLCNEEEERLLQVVRNCEASISGFVADELKVAALRSWGLLFPLLDSSIVSSRAGEMVAKLCPLLSHDSLDVRVEAAENLALLKEMAGDNFYSEERQVGEGGGEQGIIVDNQGGFITPNDGIVAEAAVTVHDDHNEWIDELTEEFMGFTADSGSTKSKRDAKEQRARFKAILAYVQENKQPTESFNLDKLSILLNSWLDIKRLAFAKDVLRDGFSSHVKGNPILQSVLGLHEKDLGSHLLDGCVVRTDQRAYYSRGRGKQASLSRNKARKKRDTVKELFMST